VVVGLLVGLILGLGCGIAVGFAIARAGRQDASAGAHTAEARLSDAQRHEADLAAQLAQARAELNGALMEQTRLATELVAAQRSAEERTAQWELDRANLAGTFAELSNQALQQNADQFLTLADTKLKETQEAARGDLTQRQQAITQLLDPLKETLSKYEQGLRRLELDRQDAYAGLTEKVAQLNLTQEQLQRETRNLVTALRSPQTRGRWGEVQLRRVVEMAGMVEHCDFDEQVSSTTDEGRLRPDMVIHLPGEGEIVVDAKVPLEAFLRAMESDDESVRTAELVSHARQLRAHVDQLAKKQYWKQFERSPQLVVAFVPGDPLLSAAYEHDLTLQEHAMSNGVLLTTPTTLIALLRTVAFTWQQEKLADNARIIQQRGAELYERLSTMGSHLVNMQRSLTSTVEHFNKTVGSLESRVMVTARQFPTLGVVGLESKELPTLSPVEATPRLPQGAELSEISVLREVTHGEAFEGAVIQEFATPASIASLDQWLPQHGREEADGTDRSDADGPTHGVGGSASQ
jgi:DNA recombination protein RmuC